MRVLVTGASGLIGTALVRRLVADDHQVTRLVRGSGPADQEPDPATVDAVWHPESGTVDSGALDRLGPFDAVVHLAGAGIGDRRWTAARKQLILSSRTRSTALLATTLTGLTTPPGVLISASAVGIYGDRGSVEITETSSTGTGFLSEVCRAWEAAAQPAVDAGIRTVFIRSGIVLAPSGGVFGKQLPLFRLGLGGRLGPGTQYRSWITIDDEIGAILHAIDHPDLAGPVNVTAPMPATDADLARALGAVLHRPTVAAVPSVVLHMALGREMADELILGGQRVLPAVLKASGYVFVHPELGDALRAQVDPAG